MEYKLVCIDMDGTLLNSKHKITETTKKVLQKAHDLGVHIVISTGRVYVNAESYSNLIGVKSPVIASNGAFVKEKDRDEAIFKGYLSEELSLKLLKIFYKYKVAPSFSTPEKVYTNDIFMVLFIFFMKLRGKMKDEFNMDFIKSRNHWDEVIAKEKGNLIKCEVMNKNEEKLRLVRKELEKIEEIEIASSSKHNIEITCKGVSKGSAVKKLAEFYNINEEEIIAIGDSENDLSMIEYAGLGIAMGNAIEKVKEKANFITDSNDNEGVANAIKKFVLKE
ncbi:MAG: Cof-type HAD-IIB family hydrolase [Clostridiaceae bacterium]